MDEFTDVACSAGDIADESSISSAGSVHASSGEGQMSHSISDESCDEERSTTPVSVPEGSHKFEDHRGSDKRKVIEDESNEGKIED